MKLVTATTTVDEAGPLTRIVLKYCEMIESRAMAAGSVPADWDALKEVIAVDEFERVGAYQEVMTWSEYVRFLTKWAGATRFEATVFHVTEVGRAVFQEIEERHYKDDAFIKKNVIAVYRFNNNNQICHLDIYEQAKDTGRWIVEAAQASLGPASA